MSQPAILKHMVTVADPVRCRMLRVLAGSPGAAWQVALGAAAGQELTVSEICAVLQLPQSTVSRHLKALQDDDWIHARRDGTSRFYRMDPAELAPDARGLWELIREQLGQTPAVRQDDERLEEILAARRSKSKEFFATEAGGWESLRGELYGSTFQFQALLGLLDPESVVGDLGCGTGLLARVLAPFVRKVIAVDGSQEMLDAARRHVSGVPGATNVDFRHGELEKLPLRSGWLDAAVLMLVLHFVPDPARVLSEASRVLKPGGRLLIVDMLPHEREEYARQMGHVWLGFSPAQIARYIEPAGFTECRMLPLPPAPDGKGPTLFTATARKNSGASASVTHPATTAGQDAPEPAGIRFEYLETDNASAHG